MSSAADDIHEYFFIVFQRILDLMFQVNPLLIYMKNQALFPSKDKSKKLKCRLLQFLFVTLRVKQLAHSLTYTDNISTSYQSCTR